MLHEPQSDTEILLALSMDAVDPVSLDALSDDDFYHIMRSLKDRAAILPLVLSCKRWREVQKIHSRELYLRTSLTDVASSMTLLSWATSVGCPYPKTMTTDLLCRSAARHNAVDVLEYARDMGCPFEPVIISTSGKGSEQPFGATVTTIRMAAGYGHNDFIVAAIEMGCEWGLHPMFDAAQNGKLATLKLMHSMGCPIDEWVCIAAARHAGVESASPEKRAVLEWLAKVGAPMLKACEGVADICSYSYTNEPKRTALQLEALRFAHQLGGEINSITAASLILGMDCRVDTEEVKWVMEEGADLAGVDAETAGSMWHLAACEGEEQAIRYLHASKLPWHEHALTAAIDNIGDELAIVKWMVEEGCPVSGRAMYAACSIGNDRILPLLEFLDAQGRDKWAYFCIDDDHADYPCDDERHWMCSFCGDAAIDAGSIAIFKWVLDRAPQAWLPVRAYSAAAMAGHSEMLRFLISEHGHVAEWQDGISDNGRPLNTLGFVMGGYMNREETIKMLNLCVELGCPLSSEAFATAARMGLSSGAIQWMEWLIAQGCPTGRGFSTGMAAKTMICSAAADETPTLHSRRTIQKQWCGRASMYLSNVLLDELVGHSKPNGDIYWPLAKVKWLHARGLPCGAGVMNAAAKHGNIRLLEWAHEQGCKCSENTMDLAAYHGQIEAMEWLCEHGCPIGPKATIKAAARAQQTALVWLLERNASFDQFKARRSLEATRLVASQSGTRDARLYRLATSLLANKNIWT